MKTLDATTIRDTVEAIASQTMFAVIATLCIRFIMAYMAASVWFQTMFIVPFLTYAYARKRVTSRIIHQRKFALFTKNPNSRAGLFGIR